MRQQINLYQPIFRQERKLFSAATVALACALVALTYVAIFGFGSYKVGKLENDVEQLRRQAEAQQKMLDTTVNLRAQRANPVAITARIEQLSNELSMRARALDVLRSGAVGEPAGFATRLEALARGHLDGVWLDHVVIAGAPGNAGNLRLEGATLDPDLVPRYLQSLAAENALQGTRFTRFIIERPESKSGTADDAVATSGIRFIASSAGLIDMPKEPS